MRSGVVLAAHASPGGPPGGPFGRTLEVRVSSFPRALPAPRECGLVSWPGWAPPADRGTQDRPARFSCPLRLSSTRPVYHFPGMEIRGVPPLRLPCLMASPSGLWTAGPCPRPPHTEPRAPGPFLFLSLGFHTGRSLRQGHCSRCGLAPGAFLTSVSGPSGTRVMGGESRLLVACVRAPAP